MGIRVVLAEDNTLLREGIARLLERADEIDLVGGPLTRSHRTVPAMTGVGEVGEVGGVAAASTASAVEAALG